MPVSQGLEPLRNKRYLDPQGSWGKIVGALPALSVFGDCISEDLVQTNISIIRRSMRLLNIRTAMALDRMTEKTGTERLVQICRTYGATEYLSGPSGKKYLDERMFREAGISVRYHMTPQYQPALADLI